MHGAALDASLRVHDQHVAAAIVRQHRRLRQHRALGVADGDLGAGEGARPQIRILREGDADRSETGLRVDDRTEQPHAAGVGAADAGQAHRGRFAEPQQRQVLLGNLAAQFDFPVARQAEQRFAAGGRGLAEFDVAREDGAVRRRPDVGPIEPRLGLGELRSGHLDLGRGRHRARGFLRRQRALTAYGNRAMIFGRGEFRLGAGLLQGGGEAAHLGLQHRDVEARQNLALLDVVTGLDVDGGHPSGIAFHTHGDVVARRNRAENADRGGLTAARDVGDGDRGNRDRLRRTAVLQDGLRQPHPEQPDQTRRDQHRHPNDGPRESRAGCGRPLGREHDWVTHCAT